MKIKVIDIKTGKQKRKINGSKIQGVTLCGKALILGDDAYAVFYFYIDHTKYKIEVEG